MRKKMNTFNALLLTIVMVLCSMPVFATENESIRTSYGRKFGYAGNLELGKTSIRVNNDELLYYTFNAENDGYYLITYPDAIEGNEVAVAWSLEKINGIYEEVDGCYADLNSGLFRFEAGINNIGIIFAVEYEEENAEIEIEYLGSEITDIDLPNGTDYPLINDVDIMNIYSDVYKLEIRKLSLVFDSGKTKDFSCNNIYCTASDELQKGENTVVVEVGNKEFVKTVTVAEVTDYVEKIELVGDGLKVVKYYDGTYQEDTVTEFRITYNDGSAVIAKIDDEIDIKTGNPETYTLVCRYSDYGKLESEELYGAIRLAGYDYLELEVEISKASVLENIRIFREEIDSEFGYVSSIGNYLSEVFEQDSAADTLRAFGCFVSYVNNNFIYAISGIFEHLIMLISSFVC